MHVAWEPMFSFKKCDGTEVASVLDESFSVALVNRNSHPYFDRQRSRMDSFRFQTHPCELSLKVCVRTRARMYVCTWLVWHS